MVQLFRAERAKSNILGIQIAVASLILAFSMVHSFP